MATTDVGNEFIVYVDDRKVLYYHKYGFYGTLKTGAVIVQSRKVRHFRDGKAPDDMTKP